ncbi:MAG: hypothetical protein JNJ51_10020 [Methylobacillus glycogenes]|nr:hypothetical protein [Methylobacillus glycogenes]
MFIKPGAIVTVMVGEYAGQVGKVHSIGVLAFAGFNQVTVVDVRIIRVEGDVILPLMLGDFEPKANSLEAEYRFETMAA